MNMGEGILLRPVAHAAGSSISTPAAAASTGFCSACTGQVARPSSLRTVGRTCHCTALSQASSNQVDLEDWEFADEAFSDTSANRPVLSSTALLFSPTPPVSSASQSLASLAEEAAPFGNQVWDVFGLPPSIEEANAATSELEAALFSSNNGISSTTSDYGGPLTHQEREREEKAGAGEEWVEPQLSASQVVVAKNPVEEAFQLLQSDPNVKGAVISIVSDPDVWHAMMKNKKVQELKRMFQKSQERGEEEVQELQSSSQSNKHNCLNGVSFLLRFIVGLSRQVVWHVQDDITKIFMSMLSLVTGPKVGCGEEEDPLEKTMRSSMMIAVVVVTVVVMKRMQV